MKRSHRVLFSFFTFATLALVLAGCTVEQSVFDPKGPVAAMQLDLIYLSFWIMTGVTVVVAVILLFVLFRYRQRKGDTRVPKQTEGNVLVETIIVIIPVILLTYLLVPTVKVTYELADESGDGSGEPMEVIVKGYQYWWEFEYPDLGIVTANELHIPVGEKVNLRLVSEDVLHAFWVPKLGGKTDNIPGRENFMWLQADEPGVYSGQCAEYCGPSHALMAFEVVAQERDDFDAWVTQMQNPTTAELSDLALEGQALFEQSCLSCHAVEATDTEPMAGPNLGNFSSRNKLVGIRENNEKYLKEWIQDPEGMKPGNLMPDLGVSDEEADALVEYLYSLQ